MAFGWGIVGTGAIARQFAADLTHAPGAHIAAVHSRSPEKAEAFRAAFKAGRAYGDLDALLADGAVDAVYIATPNAAHAEQALLAIAAGKPVLVEKPLALAGADAGRIEAAALAKGTFAMEAMWTRFLPAVRRARAKVALGEIGPIRAIRANLSYVHDETPGSRFYEPQGGGALYDLGVYPISLALHFLGHPESVSGRWFAAQSGVDKSAEVELHYDRAVARLSCGFDRTGENSLLVEGTTGTLRLRAPFLKAQRLTHYSRADSEIPLLEERGLSKILSGWLVPGRKVEQLRFPGGGLQFEAIAVMDAVRQGKTQSDLMPLDESRAALAIIEQVLSQPPSAA
ncbi:MAG TPA: Gfo/Idh/MocA family oxidoreductase [Mesorhizobium sp.]